MKGNTLVILGRPEEALECYEKALVASPDDPDVLGGIAMALISLDRSAEAVKYYERLQRMRR